MSSLGPNRPVAPQSSKIHFRACSRLFGSSGKTINIRLVKNYFSKRISSIWKMTSFVPLLAVRVKKVKKWLTQSAHVWMGIGFDNHGGIGVGIDWKVGWKFAKHFLGRFSAEWAVGIDHVVSWLPYPGECHFGAASNGHRPVPAASEWTDRGSTLFSFVGWDVTVTDFDYWKRFHIVNRSFVVQPPFVIGVTITHLNINNLDLMIITACSFMLQLQYLLPQY